jgi:leader peptidase (prepilin peptidase)/N-methyltransferase
VSQAVVQVVDMVEVLPREAWIGIVGLFGLFVGSFLNVVVHRLPNPDETVSKPARSRCPKCRTTLSWKENIPLLSWLVQGAKCRHCRASIHWRYPLIEASNALLWASAAALAPAPLSWITLVWCVVFSGLLVATAIDFERFEIPDEVSIGGMVLAPIVSFLLPDLHAMSPVVDWMVAEGFGLRMAALSTSLLGLAAGGGVLLAIGWVGSRLYGRDAMGFGDVKLLAAGGGLVGPGGALVALIVASLVASVAGVLNMLRFACFLRRRAAHLGRTDSWGWTLRVARVAGRYLPFGPYLALGLGIVLVAWKDVLAHWPFVPL